mmetsp:Transcript_83650/g.242033  ORF Transcript_83650/g.242033 Transcript_83650/m.242033 type:complete len:203 (+) Transcript_83650:76-684(+)
MEGNCQGLAILVDLFHSRFFVVIIIAIKRWQVIHIIIISIVVVIIDRKTKLDKTVDTGSKGSRFIQGETRCKKRGVVKEPDEILDGLVALVSIGLFSKGRDDGVGRVDFHCLFGHHVSGLGRIAKSLGLHDTFHVGRPSIFTGDKDAWRVCKTVGDNNLFNLVIQNFLHELAQRLSLRLGFFKLLLFIIVFGDIKSFLGGGK